MLHEVDGPSLPLHFPGKKVQHQKPFKRKDKSAINCGPPILLPENHKVLQNSGKKFLDAESSAPGKTYCLLADIKTDEASETLSYPIHREAFSTFSAY